MSAPGGRGQTATKITAALRRLTPVAVSAILVIPACSSDGGTSDTADTSGVDASTQTSAATTAEAAQTTAAAQSTEATTESSADAPGETIPGASACGFEGGEGCRPPEERVDTVMPTFSNPTEITNPYFPTTTLTQVLQLGVEGDEAARNEITVLPETKVIEWNGLQVETVVAQFVGYLGGRIVERAFDYLAQADDGSVWYLGEDVENFEDGVLKDNGGSWLAGRDGAAGMIMPSAPAVGDVYRPENVPGLVFEEDVVTSVNEAIETPSGPRNDGLHVEENLLEGETESKLYAPGYGEFEAQTGDELLTVALGVPIDATGQPAPPELETIDSAAGDALDAATDEDWEAAAEAVGEVNTAWATASAGVPALLASAMSTAIGALSAAVDAEDAEAARQAAIDVALAGLDVQLRHRPVPEVDLERMENWTERVLVDADGDGAQGNINSDVVIVESIWARSSGAVAGAVAEVIQGQLDRLRTAADAGDVEGAVAAAESILTTFDGLG